MLGSLLQSLDSEPADAEVEAAVEESTSLIGFEDLGDVLANDDDYTFLIKLFGLCALLSYIIKYGE